MSDVLNKVKDIVIDQLDCSIDSLSESTNFVDDLGADSLDVVELIMAIEEEFDMEIPDEDAEKIVTLGDVVKYIESH